jgi:hypothetical protein
LTSNKRSNLPLVMVVEGHFMGRLMVGWEG